MDNNFAYRVERIRESTSDTAATGSLGLCVVLCLTVAGRAYTADLVV